MTTNLRPDPVDKAKTAAESEQSLYAKHQKVYPRETSGRFTNLRNASVLLLLGIFYGTPLLRFDGHQAILFDLPARKFYIFGLTLWPQDFVYLAGLLIVAALLLFFFTALAGRIWCGYACPQTVWTEVYVWMERKIEGSRSQQMKLDRAPMSWRKFHIKATKQTAWLIFSFWTGFTFVGFFTPIDELATRLVALNLGPWETFWVFFYGLATYGNAGFMREQVCIYMCPYARFQAAMFDTDTLIVAYDESRGEPRGSRKRNTNKAAAGLGDCVNCTLCYQVCPTGIDIRNGLQYECIACSACIDACDEVMDKLGYNRGLIRYSTENALQNKPSKIVRPRTIIYAIILSIILIIITHSISSRVALELDVIRDRNRLFRETSEGLIENVYTLKILNMDSQAHRFDLSAEGITGLILLTDVEHIDVESGTVSELIVRLQADEANLEAQSESVSFHLQAVDANHLNVEEEARFLGPR
ncbi:MAG: cytochrome c oxidase accessory protein CcoG [Gammaproteobacteria bacterium]|nr:cytochrome c oxidase accessory protein CcoG [Gammaproteobacteria bacterium]